MRVKVTLIPLKNRIKYFIRGSKLYCASMKEELPRSRIFSASDYTWINVFGSELEKKKFLDGGKPITIVTELSNFGYSACDSSGKRPDPKTVGEKIKLHRIGDSLVWRGFLPGERFELKFNYQKAETSLSSKACWSYTYQKEGEEPYTGEGYLSSIFENVFRYILEPWTETEIDQADQWAIEKNANVNFAWERFEKQELKQKS